MPVEMMGHGELDRRFDTLTAELVLIRTEMYDLARLYRRLNRRLMRFVREEEERDNMAEVDFSEVANEVRRLTDVVDGSKAAFEAMARKIDDLANSDAVDVEALRQQIRETAAAIRSETDELAEAVAANTEKQPSQA